MLSNWNGIIRGDARQIPLADESVQLVVTSPPYWGLRKYDVEGLQIGSEVTPQEWISEMITVFREVRRVLKKDGIAFVNIGDSYCHGTGADRHPTSASGNGVPASWSNRSQPQRICPSGLIKSKDLLLMPQRLAIALQDDGWYVRAEIIWSKGSPMPESVTDRVTRSHEQIWMITKSPNYFYNADAIKEPASTDSHARYARGRSIDAKYADGGPGNQTLNYPREKKRPAGGQDGKGSHLDHNSGPDSWKGSSFNKGKTAVNGNGRNQSEESRGRTKQEEHPNRQVRGFNQRWKDRTLGDKLNAAEKDNRSSASARFGRGSGWRDDIREPGVNPKAADSGSGIRNNDSFSAAVKDLVEFRNKRSVWNVNSTGYPEAHYATFPPALIEPMILAGSRPGNIVLDPFAGSGTVAMVCEQWGRRWIALDLGYQDLQKKRLKNLQRQLIGTQS